MTGKRLRIVMVAVVVALFVPLREGRADPADAEREAQILNERGIELLQERNLDGALAAFEQAYALSPNPKFLLNMAIARTNRGDHDRAVDLFDRYLAAASQAPPGLDPGARQRVLTVKEEAEAKLLRSHGRLVIRSDPPGAEVRLENDPWTVAGEAPVVRTTPVERWLVPGDYAIHVTLEGHEAAERRTAVVLGATTVVSVVLPELAATAFLSLATTPVDAEVWIGEERLGTAPLLDVPVPAGRVAVRVTAEGCIPGVWSGTLVRGQHAEETVALTCPPPPPIGGAADPGPAEVPGVADAERFPLAAVGWATLGVGLAAAGGGAALHVVAHGRAGDVGGLDTAQPQSQIDSAYRGIERDVRAFETGAWVLYGVAAAALTTGVVLLVLDALDAPGAGGQGQVVPVAFPGGAGTVVEWSF